MAAGATHLFVDDGSPKTSNHTFYTYISASAFVYSDLHQCLHPSKEKAYRRKGADAIDV